MPHLMVQSSLHYFTNIPEDVAINTWHFDAPGGDLEESAADVADLVREFFLVAPSGVANAVGYYISPIVPRSLQALTMKVYDMSQPRPRVPILTSSATLPNPGSSSSLPLEVAVCNSFAAQRSPGVPPARRRGRVFIGPLMAGATTGGSNSSFPRVVGTFMETLTTASLRLAVDSGAAGLPWCVSSRVDGVLAPVTRGWVDNEPDTQRRRQPRPTDREVWTTSI